MQEIYLKRQVKRRLILYGLVALALIGHWVFYCAVYRGKLISTDWRMVHSYILIFVTMIWGHIFDVIFISTLVLYFIGKPIPKPVKLLSIIISLAYVAIQIPSYFFLFNNDIFTHPAFAVLGIPMAIALYPETQSGRHLKS